MNLFSLFLADFGNSDAFVIVATQSGQFYIYEYMFAGVNPCLLYFINNIFINKKNLSLSLFPSPFLFPSSLFLSFIRKFFMKCNDTK